MKETAPHIVPLRHRFKMVWVNAAFILTQMVNNTVGGYRAMDVNVRTDIGRVREPFNGVDPITIFLSAAPFPATRLHKKNMSHKPRSVQGEIVKLTLFKHGNTLDLDNLGCQLYSFEPSQLT